MLTPIADRALDELQSLEIQASLANPEHPARNLRFALGPGAPLGASIDPVSGLFRWTPSEFHGPATYPISIVTSDSESPLVKAVSSFSVVVNELNSKPVIGVSSNAISLTLDESIDLGVPGDPVLAGSTVVRTDGVIEMRATGSGSQDSDDRLHFAFQEVTGNFDVRVRVASFSGAQPFSRAGLMVRESLNADSRNMRLVVTPEGAVSGGGTGADEYEVYHRAVTGGPTLGWPNVSFVPNVTYPNAWLRITRGGSTFTALRSSNGQSWTLIGRVTVSSAYPVNTFVGLCLDSADVSPERPVVAEFADYRVNYPMIAPISDYRVDELASLNFTAAASRSRTAAPSRNSSSNTPRAPLIPMRLQTS